MDWIHTQIPFDVRAQVAFLKVFFRLLENFMNRAKYNFWRGEDLVSDLEKFLLLRTKEELEMRFTGGDFRKSYFREGDCMMHAVARHCNFQTEFFDVYLAKGGSIDLPSLKNGNTFLHYAVEKHSNGLIQYLLAHGCNPNILNTQNRSPLHVALIQKSPTGVILLLNVTDITQEDDITGISMFHVIQKKGNIKLTQILFLKKLDWVQGTSHVSDIAEKKEFKDKIIPKHGSYIRRG